MRWRALRENVNDMFGFGGELWTNRAGGNTDGLGQQFPGKQPSEAQNAKPHSGPGEKLAAGTKDFVGPQPVIAKKIIHRRSRVLDTSRRNQTPCNAKK